MMELLRVQGARHPIPLLRKNKSNQRRPRSRRDPGDRVHAQQNPFLPRIPPRDCTSLCVQIYHAIYRLLHEASQMGTKFCNAPISLTKGCGSNEDLRHLQDFLRDLKNASR